MTHTTEVIHFQKLSNGQFLAMVRCCGNASTDWPHVMGAEVLADDEKKKASLQYARENCAKLHEAAQRAELQLINEVTAPSVEHASSDLSGYENVYESAMQTKKA